MDELFSSNLCIETPTTSVVAFGDGISKEVIRVKWCHKGGALIQ
jgi:hypothetical protein